MNFAFDVVVRSTVILAFAALLSLALRRTSAAVRHGLLAAAMVAALLLPLAMRTLPEIPLPVKAPGSQVKSPSVSTEVSPAGLLAWQSSAEEKARTCVVSTEP